MDEKNVHIYLGNAEKRADIMAGATAQEKYIIEMNDTLQAENRSLRDEAESNSQQIAELEDNSDRNDKSKTYMRGLLKNFLEVGIKSAEIRTKQELLLRENEKKNKDLSEYAVVRIGVLGFAGVILPLIIFVSILVAVTYERICMRPIVFFNNAHTPGECTRLEKRIACLVKEIKEIDRAQEVLHDYLDDM
jgi:hypothetical protein